MIEMRKPKREMVFMGSKKLYDFSVSICTIIFRKNK
jgi:hypothetical protein